MKHNSLKNNKKGFTLIEMLVSIAVFTVIMVLGMTATLNMINSNRKSQSATLVLSNLSLAIEAMTKSIRVGTEYDFDSSDGTWIEFTPSSGGPRVRYIFNADEKSIDRETNGNSEGAITAPEVDINQVKFSVENNGNGEQPYVLMRVEGEAGNKPGVNSKFYLQSLISQRLLILPSE